MSTAEYLAEAEKRPRRFRFLCGFLSAAYCVCLLSPAGYAWAKAENKKTSVPPRQAECVHGGNSRRILYESNGAAQLPMASTTKILTAITVLENSADIKEKFEIPSAAVGVEGSSVYLKTGDTYSVEDLLYGLCSAPETTAPRRLPSIRAAASASLPVRMNETAQKTGALDSSFKNPHGLPCEGHYTTAHDLNLIACYASKARNFGRSFRRGITSPVIGRIRTKC